MNNIHKGLSSGKWQQLSLTEQLANIGSEVNRVIYLSNLGDTENKEKAAWRVLELIDLTIADKRWKSQLSEFTRLKEVFCDMFLGRQDYNISLDMLIDYFLPFALAVRR